ncbi:MAG: hypothetical protein KatS3mg057_1420 [Herpetosiphonaceae bacterium]|nr:MAG: hypothetical protein KatS3mg057_1420 [Herpetosiphonaceae bacterium]
MATVVGAFETQDAAYRTATDLTSRGVDWEQIKFVGSKRPMDWARAKRSQGLAKKRPILL